MNENTKTGILNKRKFDYFKIMGRIWFHRGWGNAIKATTFLHSTTVLNCVFLWTQFQKSVWFHVTISMILHSKLVWDTLSQNAGFSSLCLYTLTRVCLFLRYKWNFDLVILPHKLYKPINTSAFRRDTFFYSGMLSHFIGH